MVGSYQIAGVVATGVKVCVNLPILFVQAHTSESQQQKMNAQLSE
jgi:hypothetical protein